LDIQEDGIPCEQHIIGKILRFFLMGLLILMVLTGLQSTCSLGWLLLVILIPSVLFASPDFVIYQHGIEVDFVMFKRFISWDNIQLVRKTSVGMRIFSNKLTIFNYLAGFGTMPAIIVIRPLWQNYPLAVKAMQENLPDRFIETI